METKMIAKILFEMARDMGTETDEEIVQEEIQCIEEELEKIKSLGLDSLFYVIESISYSNKKII